MSKFHSPNCDAANSRKRVLYTFEATNDDTGSEMQGMITSCQPNNFETPDTLTLEHMKSLALKHFKDEDPTADDIVLEYTNLPLGTQSVADSAKDVVKHKMASSCGPDFNLNRVTTYNTFQCNYLGTGVDDRGRRVRNPLQTWKGTLPSCDDSLEISDELENDVRKVVYDAAGGEEAQLDIDQFICRIVSLPFR